MAIQKVATQLTRIPVDGDTLLALQVARKLRHLAQTNFDTLANAIATSNAPDWRNSDEVFVSENCDELYLVRNTEVTSESK
jgi:hypothetical protein